MRVAVRAVAALTALFVLLAVMYAGNISVGMRAASVTSGSLTAPELHGVVTIARDERGVPHIRAFDEHDAFFAQGYAQGADRLFQLDLLRRFVYGRLSEILGSSTLAADERARTVPVAQLVNAQYGKLSPAERDDLEAFAAGVNAAMRTNPVPVEFRLLLYAPQSWTAKDSMAVGFATVMDLTDTWDDIAGRTGHEPLTDPCYEAPVTAGLGAVHASRHCATTAAMALDNRQPAGSNEWAAGAAHTISGRALLANDPHLRLGIPGVWYLNDLQAPGLHVAGATLAGTPGVTLGHNERIAWGATNGTVTALSAFLPNRLDPSKWHVEHFGVRFKGDVTRRYYRDRDLFGATVQLRGGQRVVLVRWNAYYAPASPISTFYGLDRAQSIEGAVAALRRYPGPTQNFVLADASGRAAYYLAGNIPDDPLWSRGVHAAGDMRHLYRDIAFDALPHVAPSRDAIVWTANNKMYARGYPYRLSAAFGPPYRAYRIAQMLRARTRYDAAYFTAMQNDVVSIAERELARRLAASDPSLDRSMRERLRRWDGRFAPQSIEASMVYNMRRQLLAKTAIVAMLVQSRTSALPAVAPSPDSATTPWSQYGALRVMHPLSAIGAGFLNGQRFAGNGDAFTVHVQNNGFSQSFRAVWDIGRWDSGGIIIPEGNSGRPGSPHYTDEGDAWQAGRLLPLPFSDAAVRAATVETLVLRP